MGGSAESGLGGLILFLETEPGPGLQCLSGARRPGFALQEGMKVNDRIIPAS